jgi:hypothetical protein
LTEEEKERAEHYRYLLNNIPDKEDEEEKKEENMLPKGISEGDKKYLTEYVRKDLDLFYVNKVIKEIMKSIAMYEERDVLMEDYKKLAAYVVRKMEK